MGIIIKKKIVSISETRNVEYTASFKTELQALMNNIRLDVEHTEFQSKNWRVYFCDVCNYDTNKGLVSLFMVIEKTGLFRISEEITIKILAENGEEIIIDDPSLSRDKIIVHMKDLTIPRENTFNINDYYRGLRFSISFSDSDRIVIN
jgi:hypothetical protein